MFAIPTFPPGWDRCNRPSVDRITVNFEHAGKRLINGAIVLLVEADIDRDTPRGDGTKP